MKRTGLFSAFLSIAAIALASVVFSTDVNAQGRYTSRYSKRDVSNIIKRLEENSDKFSSDFKRAMNNNQIGGSPAGSRFKQIVDNFENSIDRLRSDFDRNNNWWQSRNQVQSALSESQNVNSMMNSLPFRRNLERQWTNLRNSLNTLADTYDLPGLNGGGWNGGPWNPGNPGNPSAQSPPSWARGTFYSRLNNGSSIQMTISSNGSVSANVNGQFYTGSYTRDGIFLNGDYSTISRSGNGIRTVNRNTGETTIYTRDNNGGGWNPGNPGNPGGTTPPSWARGTFFARLNDGSPITLTISNNGSVTANVNGQVFYGSYNNGMLYLNGDTSRVSRGSNNGIRTVNNNTGEYTDYRRQ